MNLLLVISLSALTIFSYYIFRKDVFSPGVVVCAVFFLSSIFVVLNEKNWDYSISPDAFFYIIMSIFLTLIGIYAGTRVKFQIGNRLCCVRIFSDKKDIRISVKAMSIISLICMMVLCVYTQHQYSVSVSLGNNAGIAGMIRVLRNHVYEEEIFRLSTILNIGISFMRACGYISLFLLINALILQKKLIWRYVVPIFVLIAYYVFSTGRSGFIGLVCAVLYDLYYGFRRNGIKLKFGKMLRYIIVGFLSFMILFWQLGKLTGKDQVLNLWDTLSIYIGSSILCFDKAMSGIYDYNYIGTNTFRGLYNILSKFGLNVMITSNHAEKIRWGRYSSNVYTAFSAYYTDYGPIISLMVIFIVGFIIGILWRKFQNEKNNFLIGVFYARFVSGATAMYSIAERFLSNNLALNAIVEFIFIVFIIRFCFKTS